MKKIIKAFIEFISIAKTDPKYGKSSVAEWPAFSEKNSFWDDGANHIKHSTSSNILLSSKFVTFLHRCGLQIYSVCPSYISLQGSAETVQAMVQFFKLLIPFVQVQVC